MSVALHPLRHLCLRLRWLTVPDKATHVANFHRKTLHALQALVQAADLQHPNSPANAEAGTILH